MENKREGRQNPCMEREQERSERQEERRERQMERTERQEQGWRREREAVASGGARKLVGKPIDFG